MDLDPFRPEELCFTLLPKPDSPRGQEHNYYDGKKRWVISWSTKSEGDGICPVKPAHMVFSDDEGFLGSVENLAAMPLDVLFMFHAKLISFPLSVIDMTHLSIKFWTPSLPPGMSCL